MRVVSYEYNSGSVCCSTIHAADCSALHRASNFSFPFLFSPEAARNSGDAWPCSSVVVVEHYSLETGSSVKHVGQSRLRLQRLLLSQPLCYNLVVWIRPLKFSSSSVKVLYALGNTTDTRTILKSFVRLICNCRMAKQQLLLCTVSSSRGEFSAK